jgi:hypothetical protein
VRANSFQPAIAAYKSPLTIGLKKPIVPDRRLVSVRLDGWVRQIRVALAAWPPVDFGLAQLAGQTMYCGQIGINFSPITQVPPTARPLPIACSSHQAASNRIEMDVVDRRED